MNFFLFCFIAGGAVFALICALLVIAALYVRIFNRSIPAPPLWIDSDEEPRFKDWSLTPPTMRPFDYASDDTTVDLSLVIPAYNEELRLPETLKKYYAYLESKREQSTTHFTFEILVVDDGSTTDGTSIVAEDFARDHPGTVRVLRLLANRGKGGAVKRGVMCARGKKILFADADAATEIADVDAFVQAIDNGGADIAIGSRTVERDSLRQILANGFSFLVSVLCVRGIRDTQCGFKMLTRKAARELFPGMHVERWAFDAELLYLAQHRGMKIKEIPVHWHEVPGSKLSPVLAAIQMARDLLRIRLMYRLGIWN